MKSSRWFDVSVTARGIRYRSGCLCAISNCRTAVSICSLAIRSCLRKTEKFNKPTSTSSSVAPNPSTPSNPSIPIFHQSDESTDYTDSFNLCNLWRYEPLLSYHFRGNCRRCDRDCLLTHECLGTEGPGAAVRTQRC